MKSLVICVPTYDRNASLGALLEAFNELELPPRDAVSVSVLVIDNNRDGRAETVVRAAQADAPALPIRYVHEPRPGVSHVRNRALETCAEEDLIAFIDDDELPHPGWIAGLWDRWRLTGAGAVFGPVKAVYPNGTPNWVLSGDFHSIPIDRDGPRRITGATCNCLIHVPTVRELGLRFDPSLSMVGGEDTLFFDMLLQCGGRLENTTRAVTFEIVPLARTELAWLKRRWRRGGLTDALMFARRGGLRHPRLSALGQGVARIVAGGGLLVLTWLLALGRMTPGVARRIYTVQRGRGMIDFAFDRRLEEYARPANAGAGTP